MEKPVHEQTYKGYTLKIYQDQDAGNPRKEWDNLGTMYCNHRRYDLGDEKFPYENLNDFIREQKPVVVLPLFLIDHSGISIRTRDFSDVDPQQWDSGQVGIVFVSREKTLKEYSVTKITPKLKEQIKKILQGEVQTYDDYLTGNVYGYVVEDKDGNEISSCWGFYPDHGIINGVKMFPVFEEENAYIIKEAKDAIDYDLKEKEKSQMMLAL